MSTPSTSRLGQIRHGPGGARYRIIATADSTDNSFFALEGVEPPGAGPPLHKHSREDKFFYVLDGRLTFFVDGKTIALGAGESLFAPRGIPHCFKNCTAGPVKFIVHSSAPQIESFFDFGRPLPDGSAPSDQQMIENIMGTAHLYGLEVLGPSPL